MASTLNSFLVFTIYVSSASLKVLGEISSPDEIIGKAGQDVTFKYNTTRNNIILGAKFGLYGNKSIPIPKLITVINEKGETCGDDLDGAAASYKGRVSFTGDLKKGHAWFRLSNLSVNDRNLYMCTIREDSDEDYRPTIPVKLSVLDTEKKSPPHVNEAKTKSPPHASEARFTDFEGVALKNCRSYRIVGKESLQTVYVAIGKAYWNVSINHEIKINYIRKKNQTVTTGFHITFSKAINKTYALSFLERAQRNDLLRGYKITCFEKLDVKPKQDKPSSLSPYLVAFFVFIGFVVVLLVIWVVCFMFCRNLVEPFNKLVMELARRFQEAVCKPGD